MGLKKARKERVCGALKNRWVQVAFEERVVELFGAKIEEIDLIVNLFGVDPILKLGLVKDGSYDRLRGGQELRCTSGKALVCVAGLGTGRHVKIKARIGVLVPGRQTLRGAVDEINQVFGKAERLVLKDAAIGIGKVFFVRWPPCVSIIPGVFCFEAMQLLYAESEWKGPAGNGRFPPWFPSFERILFVGAVRHKKSGHLVLKARIGKRLLIVRLLDPERI